MEPLEKFTGIYVAAGFSQCHQILWGTDGEELSHQETSIIRKFAGKERQQGKNQKPRRGQGQDGPQDIERVAGPGVLRPPLPQPLNQGPEFLGAQKADYHEAYVVDYDGEVYRLEPAS